MQRSKRDEQLRVMALIASGMTCESKRREPVVKFKICSFHVLGIGKTHILGQDVWSENGNECKLWEGVEEGAVWTRMSENY